MRESKTGGAGAGGWGRQKGSGEEEFSQGKVEAVSGEAVARRAAACWRATSSIMSDGVDSRVPS